MRYLKSLLHAAAAMLTLSFAACEPEPVKETPKEPQAPVIENAVLTGLDGENLVLAGKMVKFTASASVENSELGEYTVTVANGAEVLAVRKGELSGTSAAIEEEIDLGISPSALTSPFYPEVTVKVTNTDNMFTEKRLDQASVCQITVPELMDALWLVDELGHSWQMSPVEGQRGDYRTTADLAEIGTSLTVAEKITADGAVDASGKSWNFATPEDSDYGFRWIGFNVFSEELSKLLDHTVTMDASKMATDGAWKVYWSFELVQDCRVVFLNYPDGLKLQGDRFADVSGNTARYTGHTKANFEVYFDPACNWLVVKNQYVDLDEVWVTGKYASHPMAPYTAAYSFDWFATPQQTDAANMVKTDEENRRLLVYLEENFEIKLYTERKWATELQWTSVTPDTFIITEMAADENGNLTGNFGLAGPVFSEGLWMLRYNVVTKEASLEKYAGVIPVVGAGTADPDPTPVPEPEPGIDPEPIPVSAMYLVDAAGKVFPMDLVKGSHFVTVEPASTLASPFRFAEKVSEDGAIDYTGKVWGTVEGAVAEIAEGGEGIAVDPAFAVYGKTPEYVGFDAAAAKVIYRQEVWKPEAGCGTENCTVAWVQCLPAGCEVVFKGFDGLKISEVVDHALFTDIDDEAQTAVHLGASENYELHFRTDYNWLLFMEMISSSKMVLIGKNAAVGQASSLAYPIIESTISTIPGESVQMYRRPDGKWYGTIYTGPDFGGSLYAGFGWGDMQTGLSASGDYIKVNDGMWLAPGASLAEGRYLVCFDKDAKVIEMSPLK